LGELAAVEVASGWGVVGVVIVVVIVVIVVIVVVIVDSGHL